MRLWHFYIFGILGAAFLEKCVLHIYDLASWRPVEQQRKDLPTLPTGILKPLPMKAFAYVKSNNTKKSNYSPLDQFYLRKPTKMTRKMRPNRLSTGNQYEHLKRAEGGKRRMRSNATSLVNQGYAGNAVGDGLSMGPPNRPGERRIHRAREIKVPTPIIVLSLPKSGTSSLYQYFTCGGVYAAHTYGLDRTTRKTYRIGARFQKNLRHGLPILTNTEPLNVFTDIGYVNGNNSCFYPSIEALDSIARDYPHATLIVSYRPGWFKSVWNFKMMGKRWKKWCPMFPNTTEESVWESFYVEHRARIRDLVTKHPTLRHLEFDLTDPTAGQILEEFTGISQRCWGDCKPTMQCNYKTPVNMTAVQG